MRQIERETGIHCSWIHRIVRKDLWLKCHKKRRAQVLTTANCTTHLTRAKKLLRLFPALTVDLSFFTDEKVFTIAPPEWPMTECMCQRQPRNAMLLLSDSCEPIQLSVNHSWFLSQCRSWAARILCSLNQVWKLTYCCDELLSKNLAFASRHSAQI